MRKLNIRVLYTIYYNLNEDRFKIYIVQDYVHSDFMVDGRIGKDNEMLVYLFVYLNTKYLNDVYVGSWLYLIREDIKMDYEKVQYKRLPLKYKIKKKIVSSLDYVMKKLKKWY